MSRLNKHIIIVGTARSGTSWLSETLADQNRYRLLFEPEQKTRTKRGYLLCDQWLEEDKVSLEAEKYLKLVFKNRVDCDWIAQNSNRKLKRHLWPFIPKKFIIKFVRCNLSANYMNKKFHIPVIHVIRNPYEVLSSQMRVNFIWLNDLSLFVEQDSLVKLIWDNYQLDLKNINDYSHLELLTLRWCIENVIPLELLSEKDSRYQMLRYEDLIEDIDFFKALCKRNNLEPVSNLKDIYERPSSKAHAKGSVNMNASTKSLFSSKELVQINGILDIFGSSFYKRQH